MTKRVPMRRTEGRSGSIWTGRVALRASETAKSDSSSVSRSTGSSMPPGQVISTAAASSKGV